MNITIDARSTMILTSGHFHNDATFELASVIRIRATSTFITSCDGHRSRVCVHDVSAVLLSSKRSWLAYLLYPFLSTSSSRHPCQLCIATPV
jgi:hypothetical protein